MSVTIPVSTLRLRKINLRQDLSEVADLIELCFASTLDADGREYLRHLRWAARDAYYLNWLQGAAERISAPLNGFVWEEEGKIVGNLSLIPMVRGGKVFYWIANVAVHPDYRRRGIARQLTQKALTHLRERGIHSAWLQVRSDNPAAYNLYRSLGFADRLQRASWQAHSGQPVAHLLAGSIRVGCRQEQDWKQQAAWLHEIYPPDVAWYLSLKISHFKPDWWRRLLRWLQGDVQQNWCVWQAERALAFVSWEPSNTATDLLWVAAPVVMDLQALAALLSYARVELGYRGKPLQVNYPAGQSEEAFLQAGFQLHQALTWMSVSL